MITFLADGLKVSILPARAEFAALTAPAVATNGTPVLSERATSNGPVKA